jgi:hypothetical protein
MILPYWVKILNNIRHVPLASYYPGEKVFHSSSGAREPSDGLMLDSRWTEKKGV